MQQGLWDEIKGAINNALSFPGLIISKGSQEVCRIGEFRKNLTLADSPSVYRLLFCVIQGDSSYIFSFNSVISRIFSLVIQISEVNDVMTLQLNEFYSIELLTCQDSEAQRMVVQVKPDGFYNRLTSSLVLQYSAVALTVD